MGYLILSRTIFIILPQPLFLNKIKFIKHKVRTNAILLTPIYSKENVQQRKKQTSFQYHFLPVSGVVKKHKLLHRLCTLTKIWLLTKNVRACAACLSASYGLLTLPSMWARTFTMYSPIHIFIKTNSKKLYGSDQHI